MTHVSAPYLYQRPSITVSRPAYTEIGRIAPKTLTDLAELKKPSDFRVWVMVSLTITVFDLVAAEVVRASALILLFLSCAVLLFLVVRLDIVRLRWLLAEMTGGGPLAYAVPADSHGEDPACDEPVAASEILVGDLICTLKQHEEMQAIAERQPQQWREQWLGRWYSPVLAIGSESGRILLGVLGRDEPHFEDKPEKERYYRRKRPLDPAVDSRGETKHSAEVATALASVLDYLSEEEVSEDEVARAAASECGCSDWAVRNAVSVALAARLAVRRTEPWIAFEVVRLFAAPVKLGGHRACKIKLTRNGVLWQRSRSRAAVAKPPVAYTDREILAEGRRLARNMVQPGQAPPAVGIASEEELLAFVRKMARTFRFWVEDQGCWKLFWEGKPGAGKAVLEPKMQLLFLGVLGEHFKMAGLRLDREVETGRGAVDFTVTGDRRIRVLVEIKRLSNTDFWDGLRGQIPTYMHVQEAKHAIFLAVRDVDTPAARRRWERLEEEAAAVRAATGLGIEVERVDILPKLPASEVKTVNSGSRTP